MLDFIYDSLDTVKKLKFPTVKQIAQLTGAIFGLVIAAWLYFILADTIFSEGYKIFYSAMTDGATTAVVEDENTETTDDTILPVSDTPVSFENVEVEETPVAEETSDAVEVENVEEVSE